MNQQPPDTPIEHTTYPLDSYFAEQGITVDLGYWRTPQGIVKAQYCFTPEQFESDIRRCTDDGTHWIPVGAGSVQLVLVAKV